MRRSGVFILFGAVLPLLASSAPLGAGIANELRAKGYSLIPAAQRIELSGGEVAVDSTWAVVNEVAAEHMAARSLKAGAETLHGLIFGGSGKGKVLLRISSGEVPGPGDDTLAGQGYMLHIAPLTVEIVGKADAGLFYGVQSFLQLLRSNGRGQWTLPEGRVIDWPALQLRFIHWDTKHHQSRIDTLKRYIDWAAFFKANAIGFEIEDKYEFPRHPVIGAPGAYTKAEMQELTAYAKEHFIELVPQVQAPAHMAYVLKHDEFARLRSDGSNYQACMCEEDAISLIQDIYQDMIDATPGVDYFHVSTDEVYYAGICDKCQRIRSYNDQNRSLTWVEYVRRMHDWLAQRGRRMLCWVEYPLLPEHLNLLPRGLINGVMVPDRDETWIGGLKQSGVQSLAYSPQQGSELLFPNYFSSDFPFPDEPVQGRLQEPARILPLLVERDAGVIGTFAAAWDDSGLHDETFWLGWATVTQYGWSPNAPGIEQSVADFMDVFYGPGNQDMVEVYQTLMEGARFHESSLERVPATRLKPTYGSWAGKGRDTTRIDLTIQPPALPFSYDETLVAERNFSRRQARALRVAPEVGRRLDRAIAVLQGKLTTASRNRFNVEVLLSIASFERHFVEMMRTLEQVEKTLVDASAALAQERNRDALDSMVRAHGAVAGILADRKAMWGDLERVWNKGRFPKGQTVNGREFVHILDDLKDHRADRRAGLDYMLEPLENMGLEQWNRDFADFIRRFAESREFEAPRLAD